MTEYFKLETTKVRKMSTKQALIELLNVAESKLRVMWASIPEEHVTEESKRLMRELSLTLDSIRSIAVEV